MTRAYIIKLETPDPTNDQSDDLMEDLISDGYPVVEVRLWSQHDDSQSTQPFTPGSIPGLGPIPPTTPL